MPYSEAQLRRTNHFKPRPPKRWFQKTRKRVRKQYPQRSGRDIDRITAGIWHKYPAKTRARLARKYHAGPKKKARRVKKKRGWGGWW